MGSIKPSLKDNRRKPDPGKKTLEKLQPKKF